MARAYTVVMVVIFAASTISYAAVGNYTRCEDDHQCSERMYCYLLAGHCVPCTDCFQYKRENGSSYPYCSKSVDECGNCLPGFKEESFTTGKVQDSCIPIYSQPEEHSMTWYIVGGVIVIVVVLLLPVAAWLCIKSRRKPKRVQSGEEERAAGDHDLSAGCSPPLATSRAGGVSDTHEMSFTNYGENELQPLQQPRPFQRSNTPYHSIDDEQEEQFYIPPLWNDEMEINRIPPDCEEVIPPTTHVPNNQTDANELPSSSHSSNTANTSVDSGLSHMSSAVSSAIFPQHPVQDLGSSSYAVLSVEQSPTSHARSHSDNDVRTSARMLDMSLELKLSLRIDSQSISGNKRNCTIEIHK